MKFEPSGEYSLPGGDQCTGDYGISNVREVEYRFGKFTVRIALTTDGEFIGVNEIRINKDFVAHERRTGTIGYHDVEAFYE